MNPEAKNINFVYGLNNTISVLKSNKYSIDSIKILINDFQAINFNYLGPLKYGMATGTPKQFWNTL